MVEAVPKRNPVFFGGSARFRLDTRHRRFGVSDHELVCFQFRCETLVDELVWRNQAVFFWNSPGERVELKCFTGSWRHRHPTFRREINFPTFSEIW